MRRPVLTLIALAIVVLAASMCGRQPDAPPPDVPSASRPPGMPEPGPLPTEDVNLAASDVGGGIEELTGSYGPGFTGWRLNDGRQTPAWRVDARPPTPLPFPQEVVFSFFERQTALVSAVAIVLPDPATNAPANVDVWTSMDPADDRFTRVATAAIDARPGEQRVTFEPVEARFVKLRVLSSASPEALAIAEVKVIEAARRGYTPLFVRAPAVKYWKGSPRAAAQRGLDWLQHAAPTWAKQSNCFGCHVQGQVLMGQAVALHHGYRVNLRSVEALNTHTREQSSWGVWFHPSHSATVFGAMGIAYAADILGDARDKDYPYTARGLLQESASRLVEWQERDGSFPLDLPEPPIVQGQFMTTANALVSLKRAAANSDDPRYERAASRAVAWLATREPETTQDKIFKIIALMHHGTPDQKRLAWSVVETLAAEQQPDGGWKEKAAADGSNAIATGQVLYAFKQAGVSIHGPMFRRGVDFLLRSQDNDPEDEAYGSWAATHTESKRPSAFAHTMWAVIGLAGSYGAEPTGALQIVKQQGDKPPTRNLEIVLDVSGSMNTKLGTTTRWQTALDMLKRVVDELPEDLHVGLRVYGHRYSSRAAQTCSDTELVVPIAKLDRPRILATASKLRPRGETPLIRSVLQTIGDLKAAGGGSVILITDGEESCKGDPTAAAAELTASGLNLTLNIVGFTVTGQAVEAELGALASSTGGRYYSAQDGTQLSRAVMLAALHRLPYDVLDQSGRLLASGQTSELSRELPPGRYRLRIDALGQVLEDSITIAPNETTTLALGVEGDRFVITR